MNLSEHLSMKAKLQHIQAHVSYDIEDVIEKICSRSRESIRELKYSKILFTGATGFFGFWFLKVFIYLYEKKYFRGEIYIVTRDSENLSSNFLGIDKLNWVHIIEDDISKVNLNHLSPDHLIHFASTSAMETFNNIQQISKLDTLYFGTKNIFEQCGSSLQKVLFASSGVAYGHIAGETRISEKNYSIINSQEEKFGLCLAKLAAEFQINQYSKKFRFNYSIARCFSFAGEFMPLELHYAFGNFINDALNSRSITIHGDGTATRSYMYIGDAIEWFLTLLAKPKNEIINVGSDQMVTIKEIAEVIADKANTNALMLDVSDDEGNFSRSVYVPDLEKIQRLYPELQISTDWETIIERMLKTL